MKSQNHRHWIRTTLSASVIVLALGVPQQPGHAATADTAGYWYQVPESLPIEGVHMHLLPTGKVLFFPHVDLEVPYIWDPVTRTVISDTSLSLPYDLFCSGHSFLADGKLLVAGGDVPGRSDSAIFDSTSANWIAGAPMKYPRFYPTNTTLANGEVLVFGGYGLAAEVWTGSPVTIDQWRELTGIPWDADYYTDSVGTIVYPMQIEWQRLYSAMHLAPNGQVFLSGPQPRTYYLNTSGTGGWSRVADRTTPGNGFRYGGVSVMYEPGKVAYFGGSNAISNSSSLDTVEVIDLQSSSPTWSTLNGKMSVPRSDINATILADGKVLITGGLDSAGLDRRWLAAEMWDPATGEFATMASMGIYRGYHTTALLLPDGSVLSAGQIPSACSNSIDPECRSKIAEIYYPPYFYGVAGGPASRPIINSAPAKVTYGDIFSVATQGLDSANANDLKVHLIRPGSVTHSTNMDQRLVKLDKTISGNVLNVTAPLNPRLAPPGYYMLFVVNASGTPSVAKFIQLVQSDLVMTKVSPRNTKPRPGDTVYVDNAVQNKGTLDAGKFTVRLEFTRYSGYGLDPSAPSSTRDVTSLTAMSTSSGTAKSFKVPRGTSGTVYYVCAKADSGDSVVEMNESNNVLCSPAITVQ
jgi:hypothetical protein